VEQHLRRGRRRPLTPTEGEHVSILWIVLIVILVLLVLGFFGRGRF
jgi:flagellar basal body-associated protein FliL